MRGLVVVGTALMLGACGSGGGGNDGTEISIKGDADSNFSAGMGKDGKVSIDAPGFKASIDLPKIQLDADDFDVDGVGLPAGSKIEAMNVAGDKRDGKDGKVLVRFNSPVAPTAVRDWFQGRLKAKGFKLFAQGDNLVGTTEEGKAFTLTTTAADAGHSRSELTIG